MTALLRLWRGVTSLAPGLVLRPALRAHARQGADPARLTERHGQATIPRPPGPLLWLHAPSVGEFLAARDLVADLAAARPEATLLVTTTTATGGAAVARAAIPRVIHQFLPADTPDATARFLDHWQPALAAFVEADLWPHLIAAATTRRIPLALLNARPSRTRARLPQTMAALLAPFALITAQDDTVAADLTKLGLAPARVFASGDLKADAAPLPDAPDARAALAAAIGQRPLWAAVSTHPDDESPVLAAHASIRAQHPDALLLLVPRHPARAEPLRAACARANLPASLRSTGDLPRTTDAVHIADTLGETGTFFRLAPMVFLGGSFGKEGGHNPYEPLHFGAALLHGPHVRHFATAYARLDAAGAAIRTPDAPALAQAVTAWLTDPAARIRAAGAGATTLAALSGARARTLPRLLALAGQGD
jgi:3-deoxy-D-manno-octulosonic-acid transferase